MNSQLPQMHTHINNTVFFQHVIQTAEKTHGNNIPDTVKKRIQEEMGFIQKLHYEQELLFIS